MEEEEEEDRKEREKEKGVGREEEGGHVSEGNGDITNIGVEGFWCLVLGGWH